MEKLIITRPDDWHCHVRNGAMLKTVLPYTARQFARAIIMPNLKPPVTTVAEALVYRAEIVQAIPEHLDFTPLMTLYLTPSTTPQDVKDASENPYIVAFKYYPAGATTNSDAGVSAVQQIYPVLEAMQQFDVPLLIHGEVTDADCDIFDREQVFIDTQLSAIVRDFPALRIVLEHVTTQAAVQFVTANNANIAATITPQHLLYNRNALLVGGIKPHYYCLPILKREQHRLALVNAAISGNPKFFLGTDSAPHLTHLKENHCGCAGCFSAHAAIELYAEVFEDNHALDKLEGFASFYGADFYRLPRNTGTISLTKRAWTVPEYYGEKQNQVTPLRAGESLRWTVE
ncbi:MAG: dihydroorotase [Methylococcales bacterium]|nr:dihydroorotase [Methylococcales bacterium]